MVSAVLLIEDEPRLAKNIQTYLERFGFDVRKSENALDGLGEFERSRPDIVLLDFRLPDLDGLEVLNRLQDLDAGVKVIMMSGVGNGAVATAAKEKGVYGYLTKPLVLKHLKRLVEKAAAH
jgi:DNA-binding NtrC family response regulator